MPARVGRLLISFVLACAVLGGCRWFKPKAPARPDGERALILIHVDAGAPSEADGSTPEVRAAAAAIMREELGSALRRRKWVTRHVDERIDLAQSPDVYLVSVELKIVDQGNRALAKAAHVVRTVTESEPAISNPAAQVRRDNAPYGTIHYELQRGNEVVQTGDDEDRDIDGLKDVLKRMAIDMADPLTVRAREVD